ncbi:MAG: leucine-rich repeat domain-containing protein, partial [Kiritimatiellae bacterium]|nr:leucine-rich repeat domain-containing protein [Kiritimatiellia bacterium]
MKRGMMVVFALLCGAMVTPSAFGAVRGESAAVAIDTVAIAIGTPFDKILPVAWDATWVGGNSGATVVIKDNGTEVKRATGTGSFTWTPSTTGAHTLTYTTLIGGTAQSEVYSVTLYKEWRYTVTDGKATITATTHTTGNVTIPDSLNGYPVTEIPANFFSWEWQLTSLTIPNSVTSVGMDAFKGCTGITSASLPWSLKKPLSTLFPDSYSKLTNVTMTGTATEIVANQFSGCSALNTVTIPATVTSI